VKVVLDIECNRLEKPDKVWVAVCKQLPEDGSDIESGATTTFRKLTDEPEQAKAFKEYAARVTGWVGHNIIAYDLPVLVRLGLLRALPDISTITDTLIVSKLVNYSRPGGHSIEQYGEEFGLEKLDIGKAVAGHNPFFNQYSEKMEEYCARDVEICARIYNTYRGTIADAKWRDAIWLEQRFQLIVNDLHDNGFGFHAGRAHVLLNKVTADLGELDAKILEAFPPREITIREFIPKATKYGTISKTSVPRSLHHQIHLYEIGKTYRHTKTEPFNPSSHKQLIEVLNEAGWKPEDRTQTHIDVARALDLLRRNRRHMDVRDGSIDGEHRVLSEKLEALRIKGWKINEQNLSTLPAKAPEPARLLAQRILLESRRRTLNEWVNLVSPAGRIHGDFQGIGAWTHRMSHQKPNTANIPRELKEDGTPKLLGKEMRALWCAPRNRLLVGVDAEGIQLRIFAHYIEDEEFTDALVRGKKSDKTDPHSLNQRVLGGVCKGRQAAKRFIYALLLGAGLAKLAAILGCEQSEAKEALDRLLQRYTGFAHLRKNVIPKDAKAGGFYALDGRFVPLPGGSQRDREHLAMSGYLQSGEAIIVKRSAILTDEGLKEEKKLKRWMFCDIVHDEFVMECRNDHWLAQRRVKKIAEEAIEEAGKIYKLKCPLKGDGGIGQTWADIH
jgi:DNA polymerase-1